MYLLLEAKQCLGRYLSEADSPLYLCAYLLKRRIHLLRANKKPHIYGTHFSKRGLEIHY